MMCMTTKGRQLSHTSRHCWYNSTDNYSHLVNGAQAPGIPTSYTNLMIITTSSLSTTTSQIHSLNDLNAGQGLLTLHRDR
eukprot:2352282-Amphidinium_carterae.1